jgi:hypothetical protein
VSFPEFAQNGNPSAFGGSNKTVRFLFAVLVLALPAAAQTQTINFSDAKSVAVAQTYAAPQGVPSGAEVSLQNGALLVTNRTPGSFGVKWNLPGVDGKALDADKVERLSFDFKAGPDVKINWFFRIGTKFYGVTVTGADTVRPGSIWLGRAISSPLPNGWRHIEIPLREWLRASDPLAISFPVDEVLSGNWDNDTYLLAGIGGNPPGSSFQVDNIVLSGPNSQSEPPRAGTPRIEGNDIVWPLVAPAGIKTQDLKLRAGGRDYVLSSPLLSYSVRLDQTQKPAALVQELRLAAAEAGITAPNEGPIPLQLLGLKDALGREPVPAPGEKGIEAQARVEFSRHQLAPSLPRIQFDGLKDAPNYDFEADAESTKGLTSIAQQTNLADAQKVPSNGQGALRIFNPRTANSFGTTLRTSPLDVAQYPVLCFDYLAEDRARLDFQFNWGVKSYSIRFLDRDNDPSRLGILDNVKADKLWHSATVPLLEWMKKAQPEATSFEITNLSLLDMGWRGNARGVEVWLDNFRFAPSATGALKATVSLRDLTGLTATSWEFDQKPLSVPDTKAMGTANIEVPLQGRAAGLWWLHLRAQNGAGNWSQTAHFPVVVQ